MPDKLTDKEIVKALECCSTYKGKCTDCPAFVKVDRSKCKQVLIGAKDLINRLQAENERLKPFEEKIAEFKSHIRVEDMLVFASSLEEWLEFCDNLKAEAYKEFAELLCNDWLKDEDENLCDVDIAKWIVDTCAELVGEDK